MSRVRPHTFTTGADHAAPLNRLVRDLREDRTALADQLTDLDRRVETVRAAVDRQTGASGGNVLWKWDGVSTAQFGTTSLTTPTGGSASLSVQTSATVGPSLRLTTAALQGRWFVPILGFRMPARGVLRFRVVPSALGSNNMIAWMLFTNAVASNLYGIELSQSNSAALQSYKCEAGTFTVSGGTGGLNIGGANVGWPGTTYEIEWVTYRHQPYQGTPEIGIVATNWGVNGMGGDTQISADYGFGSWAGVVADGLALGANADSSASTITLDFQDLAVLAHPLDRGA